MINITLLKTLFIKLLFMILVFILPNGYAQIIEFEQHTVDSTFIDGFDVSTADINKDGHDDIIACRKGGGGEVCWYQNNGFYEFTKISLKQGFSGARSVRAADLNNNQEIDIVAAAWQANDIIFFENTGDESFVEHMVDNNFKGAHTIDLKDMNGDGNIDILCSGYDYYGHNGEIAWWENDGQDSITWTKNVISNRFQMSPFIYGEDMDNDDDIDIVACGEENDEVVWWENNGNGQFISENLIDSLLVGAHTVIVRDVDLDGDNDILGSAWFSSKFVWYENNGNQQFAKHDLPSAPGALWLDAIDLDNDGDNDLIAAASSAGFLYWYENDGLQQFTRYSIDGGFSSGFCIVPVNMDTDNDIDLLAIGRFSNRISWFENDLDTTVRVDQNIVDGETQINVYPNPCVDFVNIASGKQGENKQVSIFNSKGQKLLVFSSNEKCNRVSMLSLLTGVYYVKVEYNDGRTFRKKYIKEI